MGQIKKIAVRVVHQTLHLQNLLKLSQGQDESVCAFVSRLDGTAELYDLLVMQDATKKPVTEMKL